MKGYRTGRDHWDSSKITLNVLAKHTLSRVATTETSIAERENQKQKISFH